MSTVCIGKQRILEIDYVRGFAMFGVFFVNFIEMNMSPFLNSSQIICNSFYDKIIYFLYSEIFKEKFYLIFVFLFAYSLCFIVESAKRKNINANIVVFRRLLSIISLGFILTAFWCGTIITIYAVFGGIMWIMVHLFPKKINIYIGIILMLLPTFIINYFNVNNFVVYSENLYMESVRHGSFIEVCIVQLKSFWPMFFSKGKTIIGATETKYMTRIFGLFILGWYFAKDGWLFHITTKIKYKLLIGTSVGLGITIIFHKYDYIEFKQLFQTAIMVIGVLILSRSKYSHYFNSLKVIGQTSFSSYAFHLILGSIIFSGYGFGVFQKLPCGQIVIIAVSLYFISYYINAYMLKKWGIGIMERIAKFITYGYNKNLYSDSRASAKSIIKEVIEEQV